MAKEDKDFGNLLVFTLEKLVSIYSSEDMNNNIETRNKAVNTINLIESMLWPYIEDEPERYKPKSNGNLMEDTHRKLRNLMWIARNNRLIPLPEITEEIDF